MPFYLVDRDVTTDLAGVRSVLIVPCRFCPAASLAVRTRSPYVQVFRRFLRTRAYEEYVGALQSRLVREGIRTAVFDSRLSTQFVLCMWSAARRARLAKHAAGYEAMLVLGCDAAVETARSCAGPNGCRVVPGMAAEGIMNVVPSLRFPFDVWLEMLSLTRVLEPPTVALRPSGPSEIV